MVLPTAQLSDSIPLIMQDLLVDRSLGVLPDQSGSWPVYYANIPESPDDLVVIFETQGVDQGRYMASGAYKYRPGINIQVRSNTYEKGSKQATDIIVGLTESLNVPYILVTTDNSNSYVIEGISKTSGPIPLGRPKESRGRYLFSLNFTVGIRES